MKRKIKQDKVYHKLMKYFGILSSRSIIPIDNHNCNWKRKYRTSI